MLFEYIWIDGNNNLRSKTKIVHSDNHAFIVDNWNFDGSSTGQSDNKTSDIILKPVEIFKDPFRRNQYSFLVMCETYLPNGDPHPTNFRYITKKYEELTKSFEPIFGIEQEYIIHCNNEINLLEKNKQQNYINTNPHYCSVGGDNVFGRDIAESHQEACLYAGIKICGINAEVTPYQWEFQIGTLNPTTICDHLWIARYILNRITEYKNITKCLSYFESERNVSIDYHPKPYKDWNGSGCHTNFSTNKMRKDKNEIYRMCELFKTTHGEHMKEYGNMEQNKLRLTGNHETASFDIFSYGVSDRTASVRIPINAINGTGYIEDRRPSSNMDPYRVVSKILETLYKHSNNVA